MIRPFKAGLLAHQWLVFTQLCATYVSEKTYSWSQRSPTLERIHCALLKARCKGVPQRKMLELIPRQSVKESASESRLVYFASCGICLFHTNIRLRKYIKCVVLGCRHLKKKKINYISKIRLVVYYQCCVLIG